TREGSTIVVPLGSFAEGDERTLLAKVSLRPGAAGQQPVARVQMVYNDLVTGIRNESAGQLLAFMSSDPAKVPELDAQVAGRLGRSETAATLKQANRLFAAGDYKGAVRALASKRAELSERKKTAGRTAPEPKRAAVEADFDRQLAALDAANAAFAKPSRTAAGMARSARSPAARNRTRAGRAQVRRNAADALAMSF
ncbi:MAG: hypothetical protein DRI90_08840, partial [Deltaproteobacteria bacterium]